MKFKLLTLSVLTSTYLFAGINTGTIGFGDPVTFGTQINSLPKEKEKVVKQRTFAIEENSLLKHKQILSFLNSGDIKKAQFEADLYLNDILLVKKEGLELAVALITAGEVSKAFGEDQVSLKYHKKAFTELENLKKQNPIDYAIAAKYIVDTFVKNDLLKEANTYAKEAEKIIQANFNRRDILVADINFLESKILNAEDNLRSANENLKNAADLYREAYGPYSLELLSIELEKAKGFLITGDSKGCLKQLENTEKMFTEHLITKYPNSLIPGEIMSMRALSYIYEANFELAMKEYDSTIDFYKNLYGMENEKIAVFMAYKAQAEKNLSLNVEAIDHFKKAAEIIINKKNDKAPQLVDIYQNLGNVYLSLKEFDLAISFTQKALDINAYHYGAYHTTSRIIKANLDFILKEKNNI